MPPSRSEPHEILRPRLSERALPRLYFSEGRCRVLIHDIETGDAVPVDPRTWVLLASADGTRDIDGVLLAASREGVIATREDVVTLLERVRDAGMLVEGPPPRRAPAPPPDPVARRARDARPIEPLPGYAFRCDGRGSCCKLYATIVFSPLEAARARVLRPHVLDGGERHEHAFTPERGSGPCAGSAVALVKGDCAYLDGTHCSLHRAGGASAKPVGCNVFPLSLVDDGARVRASMLVECACVLTSASREDGDPLLPDATRTRGDLDATMVVDELPMSVETSAGTERPLAEYLAWSDAAVASLPASRDAAVTAFALASAMSTHGFEPAAARSAIDDPGPVDLAIAAAFVDALADTAARRAGAQRAWLDDRDLRRRGVSVLAAAAAILADREVLAAVVAGAGASPIDEALYLRMSLFGHHLARAPLVTALRDRAVAMWVARVFPLAAEAIHGGEHEPAFEHPIAIVEALLRGHGLRRYTEQIGGRCESAVTQIV